MPRLHNAKLCKILAPTFMRSLMIRVFMPADYAHTEGDIMDDLVFRRGGVPCTSVYSLNAKFRNLSIKSGAGVQPCS